MGMSEQWGSFWERRPRNQFSKPGLTPRAEVEPSLRTGKVQAGLIHLLSFGGAVRSARGQRTPVLSCRAMSFQLLRRNSGEMQSLLPAG